MNNEILPLPSKAIMASWLASTTVRKRLSLCLKVREICLSASNRLLRRAVIILKEWARDAISSGPSGVAYSSNSPSAIRMAAADRPATGRLMLRVNRMAATTEHSTATKATAALRMSAA